MAVILVGEDGTPIVAASGALGAFTEDYKNQVELNTDARHTHTNKTILDNTTASYTVADKNALTNLNTKVSGLANENLLLNADFQIHENNRPLEWVYGASLTPTVSEDGVQLVSTGTTAISQYMTIPYSQLASKNVTLSAKINNQIYSATTTIPTDVPTTTTGETVYINLRINENGINGYLKFT